MAGGRTPRKPSVSVPARNLRKKELGAVIFGCTRDTVNDCHSNLIFGLSAIHFSYVKNIEPGLPLFLFNYSDRKLLGIYEAAGHGKMNINPYGWTTNGSDLTRYPAQVRVRIRKQCQFLLEDQYKKVLEKNYSEDQVHFQFELDRIQTSQLISLFECAPSNSSAILSFGSPVQRLMRKVVNNLDARNVDEYLKTPDTKSTPSKNTTMRSGFSAERPGRKLQWVSLTNGISDSGAKNEGHDTSLGLEADSDEEMGLNVSNMDPDPGASTTHLPVEKRPTEVNSCHKEVTRLSGVAPCLEEQKQISEIQTENGANEPDMDDIYSKLKHLALQRKGSDMMEPKKYTSVPCAVHLEDECSPAAPSASEKEKLNSLVDTPNTFLPSRIDHLRLENEHSFATTSENKKDNEKSVDNTKDASVPCGMDNSHLEGEYDTEKFSTSGKLIKSRDIQSVIYQLMGEMKEMKAFSIDQQRKTRALEKELSDSEFLLKHLQHRVTLLESHLESPSTASVQLSNGSCGNELMTESFDEPHMGVGEVIFVMGGYDGVTWLPTVDCYSPSRGIVKPAKPMNSVRSYASATVLNGLIYNIGGWNGYDNQWCDTAECYNPLTNEWISCPSLSERKGCLASASLHDKIYALGGGNGTACFREVEMLDPALGRWIPIQSMQQKRFASAAVELGGVLYIVGGYDGKNHIRCAERFDPREASWSKIQSMNTSRGNHALTVLDGKLYALGGYDGYKYVPSIEVFDPCMGSWLAGEDMKHSRGFFVAPVIGDTIYAIGGQAESNHIVDVVETYRVGHGWSMNRMKGIGRRCYFSAALY